MSSVPCGLWEVEISVTVLNEGVLALYPLLDKSAGRSRHYAGGGSTAAAREISRSGMPLPAAPRSGVCQFSSAIARSAVQSKEGAGSQVAG